MEESLQKALEEAQQRRAEISALLEGSCAVLKYQDFREPALSIFTACKNLIEATAEYIALFKRAEEDLRKSRDELEKRVQERTAELAKTNELLLAEIIERKRAEELARIERNKLRNILDSMEDGVYIVNQQYDIGYINPVTEREFGPVKGRKCFEYFHDRSEVCPWCKNQEVFAGKSVRWEWYSFKTGKTYALFDIPVMDADGTISKLEIFHDITERKKAEEERARLAAAIESTAEAVVITDSKGMIQYINPTFEQVTGYSKDEIISHDLHILDSGKHDEAFYKALRDTLRQGEVWSGTLINKKKDGALYPEECTISPVKDPSGQVVNYVAVKRDVTEKIRLESIAEAIDAMNNMGYIFSGIRHEIGNPINTMKITLSILKNNINDYSKETVMEYIDRVVTEVSRVEYLLRNMKNFNMYETLQLMNVNITSFMDNFLSLVANDFEKKGIKIETTVHPDAKLGYADTRALQQVMLNILTNASDALEGRENPKIIIAVSKMAGMIVVKITDNGCGISEEQQKHLFKPFYTNKTHGTGLGLVIAKKMMIRMNGAIEITSRKNEGTVVYLYIPGG